jgi:ribulose-bisphosphate carboxylase large chain
MTKHFLGPKYGLSGMRAYTGQYNKPLLGSIIKPKVGISKHTLLDITKALVDGGVDFIKEDEIMASPLACPLTERVPLISNYLLQSGRKVVYCFCINGDPHTSLDKATFVADNGGNGVHINVFAGWGVYNSIRTLDRNLFLHVQKSGDRLMTHKLNPYSISWNVICKFVGLMGADTIQTGMWGGYSSDSEVDLHEAMEILHRYNVVPALSCGMHPGLIDAISAKFGTDYMANVGGAIHGHPLGTQAGALAMRQAMEGQWGSEFKLAVKNWGYVK